MSDNRVGQAARLSTLLAARKWDVGYCRLVCELFICAGLPEAEVVRACRAVFGTARRAAQESEGRAGR
jgi:hypothetical protein